MSLLLPEDRDSHEGCLCWVTSLDDDVGVWLDEVGAVGASEQRLGDDGVRVEGRSAVELLLELTLATRASKLAVEGFLRFVRWCELVCVALNGSPSELGVHLPVDGHVERVTEWQP